MGIMLDKFQTPVRTYSRQSNLKGEVEENLENIDIVARTGQKADLAEGGCGGGQRGQETRDPGVHYCTWAVKSRK